MKTKSRLVLSKQSSWRPQSSKDDPFNNTADNACINEDDGEKETGTVKIVIDTERYEYAKVLEFGKGPVKFRHLWDQDLIWRKGG